MSLSTKGFLPHTLDHLTSLILGEPRYEEWTGPPYYRTGPEIERWVRQFVPEFVMGSAGRFRETRDELERLNGSTDGREVLRALIAAALYPPDYAQCSSLLDEDIETFNNHLWYDGYRLVREARKVRLEELADSPVLSNLLTERLVELNWSVVSQEFKRMIENSANDPEDSITAACALVEAVCRSILVELGKGLPKDRTVTVLYKRAAKELGISADRDDISPDVGEEVKRILGSLAGTVAGIGHLRTKGGDAHGREYTARRVDSRIARLAIGSSATLSQFLIGTASESVLW
jgi:hypothetical protein